MSIHCDSFGLSMVIADYKHIESCVTKYVIKNKRAHLRFLELTMANLSLVHRQHFARPSSSPSSE